MLPDTRGSKLTCVAVSPRPPRSSPNWKWKLPSELELLQPPPRDRVGRGWGQGRSGDRDGAGAGGGNGAWARDRDGLGTGMGWGRGWGRGLPIWFQASLTETPPPPPAAAEPRTLGAAGREWEALGVPSRMQGAAAHTSFIGGPRWGTRWSGQHPRPEPVQRLAHGATIQEKRRRAGHPQGRGRRAERAPHTQVTSLRRPARVRGLPMGSGRNLGSLGPWAQLLFGRRCWVAPSVRTSQALQGKTLCLSGEQWDVLYTGFGLPGR